MGKTIAATVAVMLATFSVDAAERRGAVAFHYAPSLSDVQLEFFSRFEVLVTHDPLPARQVAFLKARGTKLALYEWSVAVYAVHLAEGPWRQALMRGDALLNRKPLRGGVGSPDADAYYYDPVSHVHASGRAQQLIRKLERTGYDGFFFDTTTFESVHPEARTEFTRRHPRVDYDSEFVNLFAKLRKERPEVLLITNQSFRQAVHYFPFIDWEVTESLISYPRRGRFRLRAWDDEADPWNSIRFLFDHLILPAERQFPSVRFVHLNYLDRLDKMDVESIIAAAHLYGHEAFVTSSTLKARAPSHPAYFLDIGDPISPLQHDPVSGGTYRCFEEGMVVVHAPNSRWRTDCADVELRSAAGVRLRQWRARILPRTKR